MVGLVAYVLFSSTWAGILTSASVVALVAVLRRNKAESDRPLVPASSPGNPTAQTLQPRPEWTDLEADLDINPGADPSWKSVPEAKATIKALRQMKKRLALEKRIAKGGAAHVRAEYSYLVAHRFLRSTGRKGLVNALIRARNAGQRANASAAVTKATHAAERISRDIQRIEELILSAEAFILAEEPKTKG
jgi:hypothetical protein